MDAPRRSDQPDPERSIQLPARPRRAARPDLVRTPAPGVTLHDAGATFCVFAAHASAVWVCLFGTENAPRDEVRVPMQRVDGGYWATHVADVTAGTLYGYRADGPWEPGQGHRYTVDKLMLDPYARAITGTMTWRPEVFAHVVDEEFHGDARVRDTRDDAAFVPRGVVVATQDTRRNGVERDARRRPQIRADERVIYETHVKGFSQLNPAVPEHLRGTYAGLAHEASIAHLVSLGVTSVELLPVHAFVDEPHLVKLGLTNYWGYNTVGFFAPHAAYAAADDAQGVIDEFRSMVDALHAAGMEVLLDVVYNHTAEQGGHEGATLSWRGLDNATAYRLGEGGEDVDVTGCGNTLDVREPSVMRLVLDSLRHWVNEYDIDGFRFDLAVALGRSPGDDFDPHAALLMAMQADPVLSQVTLIAEPWDVGMHGWRTGQFPAGFSEWNDRFRNTVRDFWLADLAVMSEHPGSALGSGVADLATRLTGSRDLVGAPLRRPADSINYVTAHDGFTLADLTTYAHKHNEANGEENRDGSDDNRSWNHGIEGWPEGGDPAGIVGSVNGVGSPEGADSVDATGLDDDALRNRRMRSMRNVLGTLLLSSGTPMLTAGDEFARTQGGNNNAYCQDSPIGWIDWTLDEHQRDLLATTRHLLALRRRFSVLRHAEFFPGTSIAGGDEADVHWFGADGLPLGIDAWHAPTTRTVQAFFDGGIEHDESVLLVLHGDLNDAEVTLPAVAGVEAWDVLWDSTKSTPPEGSRTIDAGEPERVVGPTMLVLTPRASGRVLSES